MTLLATLCRVWRVAGRQFMCLAVQVAQHTTTIKKLTRSRDAAMTLAFKVRGPISLGMRHGYHEPV